MKLPNQSASVRRVILQEPRTLSGPAIMPQRIKLQEWECACDAATDICVCVSGGIVRVIHAVLGEL